MASGVTLRRNGRVGEHHVGEHLAARESIDVIDGSSCAARSESTSGRCLGGERTSYVAKRLIRQEGTVRRDEHIRQR